MLVKADCSTAEYVIALNNSTDAAELVADLSYLDAAPPGLMSFDFTHMAAPLTRESREEYLPGGFGYQPNRQLVEVVAVLTAYASDRGAGAHRLMATLPRDTSRVGRFLLQMGLPNLLTQAGIRVESADPADPELGRDDTTRQNLIPLTAIDVPPLDGPDFAVLHSIRERVEEVFALALPDVGDLANSFASIVNEAVDNMVEYGQGGVIGGLYYPRVGEVEISLANRAGGFGGSAPSEQLEQLVEACEGATHRSGGGGNGISELSRLSMTCFGTLLLRNGNATLRMLPDGSVASTTDETGLHVPGASATILLQLLPDKSVVRTEAMRAFEVVLVQSLRTYRRPKGGEL